MLFESEIVNAIRSVLPEARPIALHEPDFSNTLAKEYVSQCLDSGWVSASGHWLDRFEQELGKITGAKHVIAVTNGTVALRLALHMLDVSYGDEVLMPSLSFVATANAASHLGAIPHFIDIDQSTLGMDPIALTNRLKQIGERRNNSLWNKETGRKIKAILAVHIFGHPAKVDELKVISEEFGIPLLEDSAEALGSFRSQIHCGRFGKFGTLSFNGNKIITTGGGGAVLTENDELAQKTRHIATTAKLFHPWEFEHDAVGWNDRLPSLNAALGVSQLEVIHQQLQNKKELKNKYKDALKHIKGIEIVESPRDCLSNNWLVTLRFTNQSLHRAGEERLKVLKKSHEEGLLLRPVWRPLHELTMYSSNPNSDLSETKNQSMRLLNLPSSPQLLQR